MVDWEAAKSRRKASADEASAVNSGTSGDSSSFGFSFIDVGVVLKSK
jgi:hypothetical protein